MSRIYIGNLPLDIKERELEELFYKVRRQQSVRTGAARVEVWARAPVCSSFLHRPLLCRGSARACSTAASAAWTSRRRPGPPPTPSSTLVSVLSMAMAW